MSEQPQRAMTRISNAAIAGVTALLMVLLIAPSPASALNADELNNMSTVAEAEHPGFTPSPRSVPVVESVLERGVPLTTDTEARVDLGIDAVDQQSALVRVTILEPAQNTTVMTGGTATPVVRANEGHTASATVLFPLTEGTISLWADAESAVRVEVLAAFAGAPGAPGATLALPTPETRADTSVGLAGNELSNNDMWIGLVGQGGVSDSSVRSVYLTLDVSLSEPDELVLGGWQRLALPAGLSTVTTVVEPDAMGGITAALSGTGAAGELRADVLGWVPEASEDVSRANLTGGYVVSTEAEATHATRVSAAGDPAHVTLADHGDVDYALTLVAATTDVGPQAKPAAETSTLAWTKQLYGRAQGVAVDEQSGALPQLALVPVDSDHANLMIRRGSATVDVQPLGGFLGEPAVPGHNDKASISITAPRSIDQIDISETGFFTLEGTVAPGANAVERVEISSPQVGFIGMAELDYSGEEVTWSFSAAAPDDGEFDYIASVFDRGDPGNASATDEVKLLVSVPGAEDTVVNPDAKLFNEDPEKLDFQVIDETKVAFAEKPALETGDIVMSGISSGSPDGFLGRVAAINLLDGRWIVDTTHVSLSEVVIQADIDGTFDFENGEGVEVTDLPAETADTSTLAEGTYAIADADGSFGDDLPVEDFESAQSLAGMNASLNTGEDVNLDLDVENFEPGEIEIECHAPGSGQEPTGEQIDENGEWAAALAGDPTPSACDESQLEAPGIHTTWSLGLDADLIASYEDGEFSFQNQTGADATAQEEEREKKLETKAAIALQLQAEVSVTLDFELDVKFTFKWKFIPTGVKVNNFLVQFTSDLKAQAAAQIAFETKARANFKQKIAEAALPSVVFMVGPVPIAVTNKLKSSIGVSFELKGEIALPVIGVSRKDVFGFKYSSANGMSRIKNDPETKYPGFLFQPLRGATTMALNGSVSVGPEVEFESKIYGFAGPELGISAAAGVGGKVEAKPDPTGAANLIGNAELEAFLAAGLSGKATLKIIRWQILDVTLFNLSWKLSLYKKEWEFSV